MALKIVDILPNLWRSINDFEFVTMVVLDNSENIPSRHIVI